ncbi:CD276 antigen homolog isoform X2 [Mobula birostris]|uniref:CD276 antigen homolog isoform X2 n=1 Tax=Mobula birostris TaxID=1983395 RepID=UPI003B281111
MKTLLLLTVLSMQLCIHLAEVPGMIDVLMCQGENAILLCTYDEQSFSLQNHYFSWQRQKTVIYLFEDGEIQKQPIDEQYRDRTKSAGIVKGGNLSVQIQNITAHDEGIYTCYIFRKQQQERAKIGECNVHLLVKAHYSTPTIVGPNPERVQTGDLVNLTCHSSGGYPEPTVSWTDGESRSLLDMRQDNFSQDAVSGLWSISSMIQVEVSANSSFTCTVVNTRTNESTTSPAWSVNSPVPSATLPPLFPLFPIEDPCAVLRCAVPYHLTRDLSLVKLHSWYTGVPSREVEETSETNQIEMNAV